MRLQVALASTGTLLEYTLEGALLATRADGEAWQRLAGASDLAFTSSDGARYTIEGGEIVRRQAGQRRVLVAGFADPAEMTLQIVRVVALLLLGAVGLLGGVLTTASQKPPARTHGTDG